VATFADAHLVVAVVLSPKASEKIPLWEQEMSAGALPVAGQCLPGRGLGSGLADRVAGASCGFCAPRPGSRDRGIRGGFVHIGSETRTPPERPRPDMDAVITWMSE
jgi:hypothetical protein